MTRACWALAALIAATWTCSAGGQQVKVYVKFPPIVPATDQQTMLDQIKSRFNFEGAVERLMFTTSETDPRDLTVCLLDSKSPPDRPYPVKGIAHKDTMTCDCYRREYTENPDYAQFTDAQRNVAIADTMAHELGHLLCATHNWNAPADRRGRDTTTDEISVPGNGGSVDIMTSGRKSMPAERVAGRTFNTTSQEQIRMGIQMLLAGKSWETQSPDADSVGLVSGRSDTMYTIIDSDPGAVTDLDADIDIKAMLSGDAALDYDMGFVSNQNFFVPIITDNLDDPTGLTGMFLFEPGIAPSFAVAPEGAPSSVFFRPISMDFMNPIPGSFAVGSPGDYFRTVVMSFDADGSPGADLSMTIDTRSLASTNGFKRVPEPSGLHFVPLILGLWPATARVCQRDGRRAARRLA